MRTSQYVAVVIGLCADAAAEQDLPSPEHDVCNPSRPGDTIVEARILSLEQPRYTCGPYQGATGDWMKILDDAQHARLQPTASTGCILASTPTIVLGDRAIGSRPIYDPDYPIPGQIDVLVDGAPRPQTANRYS